MWLKIICVAVIASGVLAKKDDLLESMYGLDGGNRMAICVATPSGWRSCDGALYRHEWLVARAHCIATAHACNLTTERLADGGSCARLANGTWDATSTRQVYHLVMHPWFDLALVIVKRPYSYLDIHANATKLRLKLKPHGLYTWMKYYFDISHMARDHNFQMKRLYFNQKTFLYPIWYFCITMLLPSVLFMLFFVYVTLYTGNTVPSKQMHYVGNTVPSKEMHYSKKITNV